MKIRFHGNFKKNYKKYSFKIQKNIDARLRLFEINPFDRILCNHALKGKYNGYRSISISGDIRAVYKIVSSLEVVFVEIGSHSQLYG